MASSFLQDGCVEYWSWDRKDQYPDIEFHDSGNPRVTFNGMGMICGTDALKSDWHYWEVKVHNTARYGPTFLSLRNTLLGVGTAKAVTDIQKERDITFMMLHHHNESWLVNTHFSTLYHHRVSHWFVNPYPRKRSTVIGMFLDTKQGTLSYYRDGEPLGIAYRGLHHVKDELFPVMASNKGVEMTLVKRLRNYHSLQDHCRGIILKELSHKRRSKPNIDLLPLPSMMKEFVNDGL